MGARNIERLAALCLLANGFKAEDFAAERLKDGRITDIHATGVDNGELTVLVVGKDGYVARGTSRVGEPDARAQALTIFALHEREEAAKSPGDLVQLGATCF